jgi:hypothetical protein
MKFPPFGFVRDRDLERGRKTETLENNRRQEIMSEKGKTGYFVSFMQGGQRVPPRPYDLEHTMRALSFAVQAARANRGGRVDFRQVGEAELIMFNSESGSVHVTAASDVDMAIVYRDMVPVLEKLPRRLWVGGLARDEVLAKMTAMARLAPRS